MEAQTKVEVSDQVATAELKEPLLSCDRITEEEFDYYHNKVVQLEATLTPEQILSTIQTVRSHFDFFELRDFPYFQSYGHIDTISSIDEGLKLIEGPRASLYIAMIKNRLIRGLYGGTNAYNKEFLSFFMQANPTWFKKGGKFAEISQKFL
jgi:hypothetical protein